MDFLLSIDQGTSGTKAIILDRDGALVSKGYSELFSIFPQEGFVEQDPADIYQNVLAAVSDCMQGFAKDYDPLSIKACGISNQRETFLLWDEAGKPLCNAVVWQCKRSVDICGELSRGGYGEMINTKTGLIIDPYFSGTKLTWLVQNDQGVGEAIRDNRGILFGTIDTWLLYRLTGGRSYKTDITNASRTLLFNIHTLDWDQELAVLLGVDKIRLPEVHHSASLFGDTSFEGILKTPIPINAMIGDSHSAAFGERCYSRGDAKSTLGTGSSFLMNVGKSPVSSDNGMVSTICYSTRDEVFYALEGIIVSCGSPVKWLKDNLGILTSSAETEKIAREIDDTDGVFLIPSFAGMGAPYWKMNARGAITGLSFGSDRRHIVRATLDAMAYQIKDIISVMEEDSGTKVKRLRFDGGITSNSYVMQSIADLLGIAVHSIELEDVSAVGAALLAGLGCGIYSGTDDIMKLPFSERTTVPSTGNSGIHKSYQAWKEQVHKIL